MAKVKKKRPLAEINSYKRSVFRNFFQNGVSTNYIKIPQIAQK